jgi:hypothetical protein
MWCEAGGRGGVASPIAAEDLMHFQVLDRLSDRPIQPIPVSRAPPGGQIASHSDTYHRRDESRRRRRVCELSHVLPDGVPDALMGNIGR